VQVDPVKLKLKPPGTKRLKLKYDTLRSSFAFNFNLRRFKKASEEEEKDGKGDKKTEKEAGAYTRPLFSST